MFRIGAVIAVIPGQVVAQVQRDGIAAFHMRPVRSMNIQRIWIQDDFAQIGCRGKALRSNRQRGYINETSGFLTCYTPFASGNTSS
ncbi:hypothetical protein D3C73_1466300 [compost metagenome]